MTIPHARHVWATIGPASSTRATMRSMILAGATGARFTFSFGAPRLHLERAKRMRAVANELHTPVFLIADLPGAKWRISTKHGRKSVRVRPGQRVVFGRRSSRRSDGAGTHFLVTPGPVFSQLTPGDVLVAGDADALLQVQTSTADHAVCSVIEGGVIQPGRGLLVRNKEVGTSTLTERDSRLAVAIAQSHLFDAIALSFVRDSDVIVQTRSLAKRNRFRGSILAKIESPDALTRLESICNHADAVIVGRGDLALTAPWVELAANVEAIASAAEKSAVPWVVATQLFEGLERFTIPTRAEICDLATWAQRGVAGALLSRETAFGTKPVEAVHAAAILLERYTSATTKPLQAASR